MKEENNLVSRVKRYSKVTTSMTSLATKFAGKKYLNFDLSDQKYAAQITEILGNLKGPLMKVAQLSATIPDLLPEEYARKLAELQSNAPPMSWVFVKRRMKAELGENWEKNFEQAVKTDNFNEPWEQCLFRVCYSNPRRRAKAGDISEFISIFDDFLKKWGESEFIQIYDRKSLQDFGVEFFNNSRYPQRVAVKLKFSIDAASVLKGNIFFEDRHYDWSDW